MPSVIQNNTYTMHDAPAKRAWKIGAAFWQSVAGNQSDEGKRKSLLTFR
jgi:hypothetical protein